MVKLCHVRFQTWIIEEGKINLKILEIQTAKNHLVKIPLVPDNVECFGDNKNQPYVTCLDYKETKKSKYHDRHWDVWFETLHWNIDMMRYLFYRMNLTKLPKHIECVFDCSCRTWNVNPTCDEIPVEVYDIMDQKWILTSSDKMIGTMISIQEKLERFLQRLDWGDDIGEYGKFVQRKEEKKKKPKDDEIDALSFIRFEYVVPNSLPDFPPPPYFSGLIV